MSVSHTLTTPIGHSERSGLQDVYRNISRFLSSTYVIPTVKRAPCSAAQRSNLYLLAEQVLGFDVPGDLVEFGCGTGTTSRAIGLAWQQAGTCRGFHVYDDFGNGTNGDNTMKKKFMDGFMNSVMPLPTMHECDLYHLEAEQLPEQIAFAHIDLGSEEEPQRMAVLVRRILEKIYPLMSPGAVCVLMDYHDPSRTVGGWDCSPGIKLGCDRFLLDKPERMNVLFGEEYSHAFFRKVTSS
jgi:O-methyltransferase